jgi:hypothetical protein
MGDVHIPKPKPNAIGAKVNDLIESGHELYATATTGQPQGRVRRPTLFLIALVGCGLGPTFGIAALIGLIAILLLALSDQVVEL